MVNNEQMGSALSLSKQERAEQGIDEPEKLVLKKFIVSDTTPEALAYVHKFNKRGIGVYVDELAGWFKNFNRYHKGAEQEFWLSNWSGNPVIIDRKTAELVRIIQPFISVCGTIQTAILDEIAKSNRSLNGFIDRILFVIPKGLKVEKWSDKELDPKYFGNWEKIIQNLLNISIDFDQSGIPQPDVLKFSSEAKLLIKQWQSDNADMCNETENEMLVGMYTKLEVYCIRLSLILQMLGYACGLGENIEISKQAVQDAIKLTEYFRITAAKVYSIISNASPLDQLPHKKQKFYEALPEVVKTGGALELGEQFKLSNSTVKRFLGNKNLFKWLRQGEYEKLL